MPCYASTTTQIDALASRKYLLDPLQERFGRKRLRQIPLSRTIKLDDLVGASCYHQNFGACRLRLFGKVGT